MGWTVGVADGIGFRGDVSGGMVLNDGFMEDTTAVRADNLPVRLRTTSSSSHFIPGQEALRFIRHSSSSAEPGRTYLKT